MQLRYPAMQGGANGKSLWEWQQGVLERIPVEVKQIDCLIRDAAWRLKPVAIKRRRLAVNSQCEIRNRCEYRLSIWC